MFPRSHDSYAMLDFSGSIKRQKVERNQSLTSTDGIVFINAHNKGQPFPNEKLRRLPEKKLPGTLYKSR